MTKEEIIRLIISLGGATINIASIKRLTRKKWVYAFVSAMIIGYTAPPVVCEYLGLEGFDYLFLTTAIFSISSYTIVNYITKMNPDDIFKKVDSWKK